MLFMKFVVELINLRSGLVQSLLADRSDLVNPATVPSNILEDRLQQAAAFQAMKERVESTRTDAIPVMRQLFHHSESKDWLMGRMYENMNPYKAEKEFSLLTGHRSNIPLL
jgi:hypothetical protein